MKVKNTPRLHKLSFNVWGYGSDDIRIEFDSLKTIGRLHTLLATVFNPTEDELYRSIEGIEPKDFNSVIAKIRESFRNKRQVYLKRAHATLIEKIIPTLELVIRDEIRKLTERVFNETLTQAKAEIKKLAETDPKRKLKTVLSDYKRFDRMRGRRPEVGRPKGSKSQKPQSEISKINTEHKRNILEAIRFVFGSSKNASLETKKAVATHLGKSPKTLNNWIKEGGWTWAELVAEGARGNKNQK